MKITLIMTALILLSACSPGNPVPEKAVSACLTAGGEPNYNSSFNKTVYKCLRLEDKQ